MKSINRLALALPILALAGCAALDQVAKDIQKATAPVMVTDTLPQICQAAKNMRNCTPLDHQFGLALTTDCVQLDQGVSLSRPSENGQKRTPPTRWKKTERCFPLSLVVASPVQEELLDQRRHTCACDTAAALGVYQAEDQGGEDFGKRRGTDIDTEYAQFLPA